jgi:hypothetical protein
MISIAWEKNAINQIINIHYHFFHDFNQIVKFDIDIWDRFFVSRLHRF